MKTDDRPTCFEMHANLLYQSRDRENAIKWPEKALEKAEGEYKERYIATLEKMKKGEQTWGER